MNTNFAAWQSCFRKKLFWSTEDATTYMNRLWAQRGTTGLSVYPCELGNTEKHFHVGHPPRPARRAKLDNLHTYGRQTVLQGAR